MKLLRWFLLILNAVFLLGVFVTSPALAQDVPINPTDTAAELRLSALTVTLLVSAFLPIVNGLLTTLRTSGLVKGIVTLILNGVTALVVQATLADGSAVFSEQALVQGLLGVVVSVAMYANVYKPAGLTSSYVEKRGSRTGTSSAQTTTKVLVPGKLARVGIR